MDNSQGWPQLCRAIFILAFTWPGEWVWSMNPEWPCQFSNTTTALAWAEPTQRPTWTAGQAKAPAGWLKINLTSLCWLSPEVPCEYTMLLHLLHKISCDRWLQTRFSFAEAKQKAWVQLGVLLCLHSTKCGFDMRAASIALRHQEIFTDGQRSCFPTLLFLSSFLLLFPPFLMH